MTTTTPVLTSSASWISRREDSERQGARRARRLAPPAVGERPSTT
jgi:hypothetical protein